MFLRGLNLLTMNLIIPQPLEHTCSARTYSEYLGFHPSSVTVDRLLTRASVPHLLGEDINSPRPPNIDLLRRLEELIRVLRTVSSKHLISYSYYLDQS